MFSFQKVSSCYLCANDAIAAIEVWSIHVHGATFATCTAALFSCQFAQHASWWNPHQMSPPMNTVRWNDVVLGTHCGFHSCICKINAYLFCKTSKWKIQVSTHQQHKLPVRNINGRNHVQFFLCIDYRQLFPVVESFAFVRTIWVLHLCLIQLYSLAPTPSCAIWRAVEMKSIHYM